MLKSIAHPFAFTSYIIPCIKMCVIPLSGAPGSDMSALKASGLVAGSAGAAGTILTAAAEHDTSFVSTCRCTRHRSSSICGQCVNAYLAFREDKLLRRHQGLRSLQCNRCTVQPPTPNLQQTRHARRLYVGGVPETTDQVPTFARECATYCTPLTRKRAFRFRQALMTFFNERVQAALPEPMAGGAVVSVCRAPVLLDTTPFNIF